MINKYLLVAFRRDFAAFPQCQKRLTVSAHQLTVLIKETRANLKIAAENSAPRKLGVITEPFVKEEKPLIHSMKRTEFRLAATTTLSSKTSIIYTEYRTFVK